MKSFAGQRTIPERYPYVCPICLGKTGEIRVNSRTHVVVFHRLECPVRIRMQPVQVR